MTFIVVAVGHWELVALILEVVSDIHSEPGTNMGMVEPWQEVHDTNKVCLCMPAHVVSEYFWVCIPVYVGSWVGL